MSDHVGSSVCYSVVVMEGSASWRHDVHWSHGVLAVSRLREWTRRRYVDQKHILGTTTTFPFKGGAVAAGHTHSALHMGTWRATLQEPHRRQLNYRSTAANCGSSPGRAGRYGVRDIGSGPASRYGDIVDDPGALWPAIPCHKSSLDTIHCHRRQRLYNRRKPSPPWLRNAPATTPAGHTPPRPPPGRKSSS